MTSNSNPNSQSGKSDARPRSKDATTRQTLVFDDNQTAATLYGDGDRTLRVLEQELGVDARA